MNRRLLGFVATAGVGIATFAALSAWTQWQSYRKAEKRLATGVASVRPGMSRAEALGLLGRPSFTDPELTPDFLPDNEHCRIDAKSGLLYVQPHAWYANYPSRQTVIVYFGADDHVVCVERSNIRRDMYR